MKAVLLSGLVCVVLMAVVMAQPQSPPMPGGGGQAGGGANFGGKAGAGFRNAGFSQTAGQQGGQRGPPQHGHGPPQGGPGNNGN